MPGIAAFVNGSATISTTEYSIPSASTTRVSQTDDCSAQLWLDLANLVAGDQFRLRLYEKINGSAERLVAEWYFDGAQAFPAFVSPSFLLGEGWDWTLLRTAGSDRSIGWSIRKVTN